MTAQVADVLIYKGEKLELFSNPLESYFKDNPSPAFRSPNTGNWRGYIATWKIESDRLYLVDITGWLADFSSQYGTTRVGFAELFPEHPNGMEASWFSGQLRVPQGELLQYVHMGYSSIYERELLLEIRNGKLVATDVIDNTETPSR